MSMWDYMNLPWQWQQPVERNPNPCRSMKEYRDQWTSTPSYSVTPTYAPPPHPHYASWSQPQPPQPISPVEQAILDLTKLVGDAVEEQKKFNAQLSQKIHTGENSLDQRLDGLQTEMDKKIDNLHYSISRLSHQHDHQEEGNLERECIDTVLGEQTQLQQLLQEEFMQELVKDPEELPGREAGGGRGKKEGEEPQKLVLQPIPTELNPTINAKTTHSLLPIAPSTDQVYILPTPGAYPTLETPSPKATPFVLPMLQNFRKLVAIAQAFSTTSKTMAAAHTA